MIIKLKNKDTLILMNLNLNAVLEKMELKKNKKKEIIKLQKEILNWKPYIGDPIELKNLEQNLNCKKIKKNMGWCNDINSKFYNKEIKINKKIKT